LAQPLLASAGRVSAAGPERRLRPAPFLSVEAAGARAVVRVDAGCRRAVRGAGPASWSVAAAATRTAAPPGPPSRTMPWARVWRAAQARRTARRAGACRPRARRPPRRCGRSRHATVAMPSRENVAATCWPELVPMSPVERTAGGRERASGRLLRDVRARRTSVPGVMLVEPGQLDIAGVGDGKADGGEAAAVRERRVGAEDAVAACHCQAATALPSAATWSCGEDTGCAPSPPIAVRRIAAACAPSPADRDSTDRGRPAPSPADRDSTDRGSASEGLGAQPRAPRMRRHPPGAAPSVTRAA
jgi:hypothetical protein